MTDRAAETLAKHSPEAASSQVAELREVQKNDP